MNILMRNLVISTFLSGAVASFATASNFDPNNRDLVGMARATHAVDRATDLYQRFVNQGRDQAEQNQRNDLLVRVASMRRVIGGSTVDWDRLTTLPRSLENVIYGLSHLVVARPIVELMRLPYGELVDALLPMRADAMANNVEEEVRGLAVRSRNPYAGRIAEWAIGNFPIADMQTVYERMVAFTPRDLNEAEFAAALPNILRVYGVTSGHDGDLSAEGDNVIEKVFHDFLACRRMIEEINRLPAGPAAPLTLANFNERFVVAMQAVLTNEELIPVCALRMQRRAELLYWYSCYDGPNPINIRAMDWKAEVADERLRMAAGRIDARNRGFELGLPGGNADHQHVGRVLARLEGHQAGRNIGFKPQVLFQSPYDLLTEDADINRFACDWGVLEQYMRDWVRDVHVEELPQEVITYVQTTRHEAEAVIGRFLDDARRFLQGNAQLRAECPQLLQDYIAGRIDAGRFIQSNEIREELPRLNAFIARLPVALRDYVRAQETVRVNINDTLLYVLLNDGHARSDLDEPRYEKVRWGLYRIMQFLRRTHGDQMALTMYVNHTMGRCNDGIRNYVQSGYTDPMFEGMVPVVPGAPLHRKISELKNKLVKDLIAVHATLVDDVEYPTATPLLLSARLASMLDRNPQEMLYPQFADLPCNSIPEVMQHLLQGWARDGGVRVAPSMLSALDLIQFLNANEDVKAYAEAFILNDPKKHIHEFEAIIMGGSELVELGEGPTTRGWLYILERLGLLEVNARLMHEILERGAIGDENIDDVLAREDREVKAAVLEDDDFYR